MEHIWAPWRLAYVTGGDKRPEDACFLCTARDGKDDAAALVIARSKRCFAILNRYPYNAGHLMIAPNDHVPGIEDLSAATLTAMMTLVQRCLGALRATMQPEGFNMGINQGKVAGAGLADHVHYHIVPRWNGDTNFMPTLAHITVIPELLDDTYRKLRAALETDARAKGSSGRTGPG
jgi:ATP adenylyltransferase